MFPFNSFQLKNEFLLNISLNITQAYIYMEDNFQICFKVILIIPIVVKMYQTLLIIDMSNGNVQWHSVDLHVLKSKREI